MSETIVLRANGLEFTALTTGPHDGELVILLHGFPDDASTFTHQMATLAAAGYRCVAPTMRGYEPSSQPSDGDYGLETLASDVVGWIDDLGVDRAHVVGHDWGAAVAYVLAVHHAERLRTVTAMAVPPIQRIPEAVRRVPRQVVLSWYMTFFQLPVVAERALRAGDWRLLRWFWRRWSRGLSTPDSVVATFERSGVVGAALGYYRANATPPLLLGLRRTLAMAPAPSGVPVTVLHGADDGCMAPRLFEHAARPDDHPRGLRVERLEGVGHFLHLETPERVDALLLEVLAS